MSVLLPSTSLHISESWSLQRTRRHMQDNKDKVRTTSASFTMKSVSSHGVVCHELLILPLQENCSSEGSRNCILWSLISSMALRLSGWEMDSETLVKLIINDSCHVGGKPHLEISLPRPLLSVSLNWRLNL
jgi:hypothetical protein